MAFCSDCGAKLIDGASFCERCGKKLEKSKAEASCVYEGDLHKCPNCGETLRSFVGACPACGIELRNTTASISIKDFQKQLQAIDEQRISLNSGYSYKYISDTRSEEREAALKQSKINLISTYPVPNSKEDILEFMILASTNFNPKYYLKHLHEEDISDAWLAKIEQCYSKARLTLSQENLTAIEDLYNQVKASITPPPPVPKKNEQKLTKRGFSSWSPAAKFFWVVLNIYTLGVPAIIYASRKR